MRGYGEHSWFTKDQGATYTRIEFGNLVEVGAPRCGASLYCIH